MNGRGWGAIRAALTGLALCPLLGCGGKAVDGRRPVDDDGDVLFEALPQRLVDCDALRGYASARAEDLLALAPTGNPLAPLFDPGGSAGFEQPAYAAWPEATRQPGGGRLAYARSGSRADAFYLVTDQGVSAINISPSEVGGMSLQMPAGLKQARDGAAPTWIFADGARLLVVGEIDGSAFSATGEGTFFWQFDLDRNSIPLHQQLSYVDARLLGARRLEGSVQVLMVGGGGRLGLAGLPPEQRADSARLAEVRAGNRAAIDAAQPSDWLPSRVSADAASGAPLAGAAVPAIECSDIYAPATPSGLQLLTLVDVDLAQGLPSWQASGLYTGNVQVFAADEQWALVTEPWWSVSEQAAGLAAGGSPETIVHTFGMRARQLEPLGSIGLRAAPQHDPVAANDGQHWLLATHTGYGPALNAAATDEGRVWSFQTEPGALTLLGRSPTFPLTPETQTEFVPGVAYVHTPGSTDAASAVVDLSDPSALALQDGPGGDFRVLPWRDGQHVRVDLTQIAVLSGLQERTHFEQWAEPSLETYAMPEQGLLLDVPPDRPWHRTLRVHRLAASDPPETMGTLEIRATTVLPPLIANGVLVNAYFMPKSGRASGGSMNLETFDANTLSSRGSVGGSY